MEIILVMLAFLLMLAGMLGSFIPVLPGIPLSWIGLLLLHFTVAVPMDYIFLGITLAVTIIIFALQYIIPALGTKYFGGSKSGMIGATIGLLIGIFLPVPGGILIGAFLGAYIGEMFYRKNSRIASKAAFGSFLGLLASTLMEFFVTLVFFILFILKTWEYKSELLGI